MIIRSNHLANSSTNDYHTTNSSTSEVVGGTSATSAGVYACSLDPETWTTTDRVVVDYIYHPAVAPVYGEPYTGCGYNYHYSKRYGSHVAKHSWYPIGSTKSENDTGASANCPAGYRQSGDFNYYANCSVEKCPVAPDYVTAIAQGRPYPTLITPGQDAWNEPVYGNVTTTHHRDTFGA